MTVRKAGVLVAQLPRGARCWRANGDDRAATREWLLLRKIEQNTAAGNWQRGGGKGEKPKAEPMPSEEHALSLQEQLKLERADQARQRHLAKARAKRQNI